MLHRSLCLCIKHLSAAAILFSLTAYGSIDDDKSRAYELFKGLTTKAKTLQQASSFSSDEPEEGLFLNAAHFLKAKQRNFISDGYSLFTQATLELAPPESDATGFLPQKKSCIVTYDSWNETYKIANQNDQTTFVTNQFEKFIDVCLKFFISSDHLNFLLTNKKNISLQLLLDPVSHETAEEMKNWLKKSQPGPLKPLITYFIGDISLVHKTTDVVVTSDIEKAWSRESAALNSSLNQEINGIIVESEPARPNPGSSESFEYSGSLHSLDSED